jgi:hypothetical protein
MNSSRTAVEATSGFKSFNTANAGGEAGLERENQEPEWIGHANRMARDPPLHRIDRIATQL